jgi:hypothetical protein
MNDQLLQSIERQAAECLGALDLLIAVLAAQDCDPSLSAYLNQLRRLRRDLDMATAARVSGRLSPNRQVG